jgi:hypothetical protein
VSEFTEKGTLLTISKDFGENIDIANVRLDVNPVAAREIAFKKYCSEKGIDADTHYFLFTGVELPRKMSATQFRLRNESVASV